MSDVSDVSDVTDMSDVSDSTAVSEDHPALSDWPPREILERRAEWERYLVRRKRRNRIAILVALALIAAGFVFANRDRGARPPVPAAASKATSTSVAWSVDVGTRVFVVVLAEPEGRAPAALAIPEEIEVDLPGGGPPLVEKAAAQPGLMVAAVQATLGRRVEHYVASNAADLMSLVDRIGGIQVQTEASLDWEGGTMAPGSVHLSGGQVVAYLQMATPDDSTGRWEEVLTGLFSGSGRAERWRGQVGLSDSNQAAALLVRAHGALVLEVPTAPAEDGNGLQVDPKGVAAMVRRHFGPARPLVRVIVLNGNGGTGFGAQIAAKIAPAGFRVVAAQNASTFDVVATEIVAAKDSLLPAAEQVRSLIGLGTVYVGPQPTGIADITIVVGKDFTGG
ncbi:MAG TPA: LCP family protein [Actinomycetota bacterium]